MRYRFVMPLLLLAVATACASAGGAQNGTDAPKVRRSRDVITLEEIQQATGLKTAYDAVQRLRPYFLQTRGTSSFGHSSSVTVYVNGMPQGGPSSLEQINIQQVEEIRYLSASDATIKYGTGVTGGVIEVKVR